MSPANLTLTRTIDAPAEVVFDVITDHVGYADFVAPIRTAKLERQGSPTPNGVGAVRAMTGAGPVIREEVTEYQRPQRFSYQALAGLPTKSHHATIELVETGGKTKLTYRIVSEPSLPLPGPVWSLAMRPLFMLLAHSFAAESERRAAKTRNRK